MEKIIEEINQSKEKGMLINYITNLIENWDPIVTNQIFWQSVFSVKIYGKFTPENLEFITCYSVGADMISIAAEYFICANVESINLMDITFRIDGTARTFHCSVYTLLRRLADQHEEMFTKEISRKIYDGIFSKYSSYDGERISKWETLVLRNLIGDNKIEKKNFRKYNFIKNNHVTIFLIMLKKNSNLNRAVPRCVVREYFL